ERTVLVAAGANRESVHFRLRTEFVAHHARHHGDGFRHFLEYLREARKHGLEVFLARQRRVRHHADLVIEFATALDVPEAEGAPIYLGALAGVGGFRLPLVFVAREARHHLFHLRALLGWQLRELRL